MMLSHYTPHKVAPMSWSERAGVTPSEPSPTISTNWDGEFTLASVFGREIAGPLSDMRSVLAEVERSKLLTAGDMQRLHANLDSASTLAMQSQQIARLACGRLRQSHEKLKLDALVLSALQERKAALNTQGIEVFQRLRPVEVIVDASLLHSLIGAALDWATGQGHKITVTLELQNWPEHGMLMFKISHAVADPTSTVSFETREGSPDEDSVRWYLVNEISHAMGLAVERTSSKQETCLLIEFSRTVTRLEGLTAVEVDTGFDSLHSESKPMAGTQILLITDDARLQLDIKAICKNVRLVLDCVTDASHAIQFCEARLPSLIIIDQQLRNPVFNHLFADLRHTDPNFPFIEIAAAANTLEMAGWTSESMSRLSRDALDSHLVTFVATELSKIM